MSEEAAARCISGCPTSGQSSRRIGPSASSLRRRRLSRIFNAPHLALVPNYRVAAYQGRNGRGQHCRPAGYTKGASARLRGNSASRRRTHYYGQALAWTFTTEYDGNLRRGHWPGGTNDRKSTLEGTLIMSDGVPSLMVVPVC